MCFEVLEYSDQSHVSFKRIILRCKKNGAKNCFAIFVVCHLPISDRRPRNCRSFAERNPVGENQRAELQEALQVPVPRQDGVQQRKKPVSGTASHLLLFMVIYKKSFFLF